MLHTHTHTHTSVPGEQNGLLSFSSFVYVKPFVDVVECGKFVDINPKSGEKKSNSMSVLNYRLAQALNGKINQLDLAL